MKTLTIEIPENAEKTLSEMIGLLGGKVITFDSKVNSGEMILSRKEIAATLTIDLEAIVFMKLGYHAKQDKVSIIERKKLEFKKAGVMFWGYGGTACHPEMQVQQFVKDMHLQERKVFLAMSFTKSKPGMDNKSSLRYSVDKLNWNNVPDGIEVTGSKHAIICSELINCDINIDLNHYKVAIGASKGRKASDYIKGQSDKGCLANSNDDPSDPSQIIKSNVVKISLLAEIVEPYAVFMQ